MKKFSKIWSWALLLVASVAMAACTNDEPDPGQDGPNPPVVEPNFPSLVTDAVDAGEIYTLTIEPNMDWVVSVPTETATYFQILDNGSQRYEMRGKAGKHEIQIQVADMQEFDKAHTCVVSMTMDKQTKTIAELTLYPLERYLRVYVGQVDSEENDFVYDDSYQVVYGSEPVTTTGMIWPTSTIGYMQYIKVDANFPWTIGGEIPAWINLPVTSGEAGMSEGFRMDSRWSAYPAENTSGKLLFQDLSGEEPVTVLEFEVTIPGSKDYCALELAPTLEFDVNGNFYNDGVAIEGTKAIGSLVSMKGARIYVLAYNEEGTLTTDGEWVLVNESEWDSSEGDAGLQRRAITVNCTANELTTIREALILALPKTKTVDSAADLLQGGDINPAYEEYVVSVVLQEPYEEPQPVYYNDFDYAEATKTYGSGQSWPYLDQFDGWMNEIGSGVEMMTYSFKGASARANSTSDGEYSDYEGSGMNNIFFGKSAYLVIEDLLLDSQQLRLTFGGEKYLSDSDNHFKNDEFLIRLSADGENWSKPIDYTAPAGEGRWNVASADFTLPESTRNLWIRFDALVDSAYRIDDVKLDVGEGGQLITFDAGPIVPEEPADVVKATVQEFLNAAEDNTIYELTGEITAVANETYGNFDLTDATGTVYVYGLLTPEGDKQTQWAAAGLKVGDTITVQGKRSSYNDKPQMKDATYVSHVAAGGNEPEPEPEPEPSFDSTDYEAGTVTSTEEMEISFWYPEGDGDFEGAAEQGASLRRVVSGTLYDKYASYNVPIYWLVYEGVVENRNMCMLKDLPATYYKLAADVDKEWLSFEPGDYATVSMDDSVLKDDAGESVQATGAVVLYSNAMKTRCKMVLVCTWRP